MEGNDWLRQLRGQVRSAVPSGTGVYTWLGAGGERLYVGKSRNLKSRMLSYLAPGQLRPEARQRHLVSAIEGFEWRETAGELMALLLEDALIKQFNPRHNERQKDYRERRYLVLTDDDFPACLVVEELGTRSGTVFGPFKDEYFATDLRTLLTDAFGLRACTDREPSRHSARYDLGQCLAPCRGVVSVDDYAQIVHRARQFLEGDSSWVHGRLSAMMEDASASLQFERAAGLRDALEFCGRFAERQRFFNAFETATTTFDEPGSGLRYEFLRGAVVRVADTSARDVDIPAELQQPLADPRLLLDRANVVYTWGRPRNPAR